MTMTEKILARGAGRDSVRPGDLVLAKVDFAMGHDLTIPPAGKIMREQMGAEKIWDPERVAVTQDHFQPAKDAASATLGRLTREFSRDMGIKWYFEVGQGGICHTVLPEHGLVLPGELVVGADSHSCTYGALNNFATGIGSTDLACVFALGELWFRVPETLKFVYHNQLKEWVEAKDLILYVIGQIGVDGARSKAMEHTGEALRHIDMEARLTMTNMAIEAGAKNGIMEFDEITKQYLDGRAKRPYTPVTSDPDAEYEEATLPMRGGDTLLLFTDGLIERRHDSIDDSMDSLLRLASRPIGSSITHYADYLLSHAPSDTGDDACLVAVRVC